MPFLPSRRGVLAGLAAAPLARPALAQDGWPRRTITILCPAAAGGATDIISRVIAAQLQKTFGVSVVVDNRGGAGGSIATEAGAIAAPDGYTLTMGQLGTLAVNPFLYPRLKYDPLRDFAPVGLIAQVPMVLVAPPSAGTPDLASFVAKAKAEPGGIEYGSAGAGSNTHIGMVAFAEAAGVQLVHVPFRGSGALTPLLLSGSIKAAMSGTPSMLPLIKEKRLDALAVSAPRRIAQLPDVPAIAEFYPGFEAMQWYGLIAPVRTPAPILARLSAAVNEAIVTPEMTERLASEGAVPDVRSPEGFRDLIRSESERWGAIVRRNNLRPGE
ncbi:tripartite tricarboxylate transporter substrate binding protein [Roseomonas nepalensis]|uniref:Tripartite tricarboxylate transporter substrate binding protein n=1 Tax=Muricoccus nepalensis TaxID=1854500 RepID=A0A502F6X0_9PROT|nr:tripartite tricarboxylate transporter substrate binding protein [Roseomonas nepalensis]TPG44821.1 tripartite tricarboxylate transporter substrate binding protein [Roseomonas nepalensis]